MPGTIFGARSSEITDIVLTPVGAHYGVDGASPHQYLMGNIGSGGLSYHFWST